MMSLIDDDQKEHFTYLAESSNETLIFICKLSLDYLRDGPKPDKCSVASERLGITTDRLMAVVQSMVFYLITSIRLQQPSLESLSSYGFSEEKIDILWEFIQKERETVRKILSVDHKTPHFRDLEWRLETRLASRALHHQMTPIVTLKLHLDTETINENKEILNVEQEDHRTQNQVIMQMDPGSLRGIIQSLEDAIQESKSHRTRLFVRAFQK